MDDGTDDDSYRFGVDDFPDPDPDSAADPDAADAGLTAEHDPAAAPEPDHDEATATAGTEDTAEPAPSFPAPGLQVALALGFGGATVSSGWATYATWTTVGGWALLGAVVTAWATLLSGFLTIVFGGTALVAFSSGLLGAARRRR